MKLAGVDEAGRGPLVGPVVAAAVILPTNFPNGLTDSKKLSERSREKWEKIILNEALAYKVVSINADKIDEINILNATMLAMKMAVEGLAIKPDLVQVDGNKCPDINGIPVEAIVKGDMLVAQISAASILAKVARDRYMYSLDKKYPAYGFAKHKGYPTKQHMELLNDLEIIKEYRKSFAPVRRALEAFHN